MTADDLIRWAHRKMGGDPDGPTLRRDQFESDAEWEAAQRAVDLAEDDLAAARRAMGESGEPAGGAVRAGGRGVEYEPVGSDLWPDPEPGSEIRLYRAVASVADDIDAPVRLVADPAQAAKDGTGKVEVIRLDPAQIDDLAPMRGDGVRRRRATAAACAMRRQAVSHLCLQL